MIDCVLCAACCRLVGSGRFLCGGAAISTVLSSEREHKILFAGYCIVRRQERFKETTMLSSLSLSLRPFIIIERFFSVYESCSGWAPRRVTDAMCVQEND